MKFLILFPLAFMLVFNSETLEEEVNTDVKSKCVIRLEVTLTIK